MKFIINFLKNHKNEFFLLGAFFVFMIFFRIFKITCIFRFFTKIPCPTCNITRALIALFHFNFSEYLKQNVMAVPVGISFVSILFFNKKSKLIFIFSTLILIINFFYYIYRMIFNLIP